MGCVCGWAEQSGDPGPPPAQAPLPWARGQGAEMFARETALPGPAPLRTQGERRGPVAQPTRLCGICASERQRLRPRVAGRADPSRPSPSRAQSAALKAAVVSPGSPARFLGSGAEGRGGASFRHAPAPTPQSLQFCWAIWPRLWSKHGGFWFVVFSYWMPPVYRAALEMTSKSSPCWARRV